MAGPCEHGNEPSGTIKGGEFVDWVNITSQEGLYSMESVTSTSNATLPTYGWGGKNIRYLM
jgi:hypothetical protein